MARPATPADIDAICRSLPEVELGTSWGDRPTYKVLRGPKGKGFLLHRRPHKNAVHPETGEMYGDLLVQESRLREIDVDESREVLTDAWLTKAPKSLAAEFLTRESGEPADG